MKKLLVLLCVLACWLSIFVPCYADNNTEVIASELIEPQSENEQGTTEISESIGMVYASGEELENVYAAIMSDVNLYYQKYGATLVKESISPVYTVNMERLYKEKAFVLTPWYRSESDKDRMYCGKLLDEKGMYLGMRYFCSQGEGTARESGGTPFVFDKENPRISASPSYADHAERIRKILGAENVIPPTDVRVVNVYSIGLCFYVHNQDYQAFIPIGKVIKGETIVPEGADRTLSWLDLLEIADQYGQKEKAYLQEKEQWEKEHPGQEYLVYGQTMSTNGAELVSGVDNITDITSYLNIDYTKNWDSSATLGADLKPIKEQSKVFLPFLFAGVGVLLVLGAVVIFALKIKQKRMQCAKGCDTIAENSTNCP